MDIIITNVDQYAKRKFIRALPCETHGKISRKRPSRSIRCGIPGLWSSLSTRAVPVKTVRDQTECVGHDRFAVQSTHLRRPGVPYPVPALVDTLVEQVDDKIEEQVKHANGDERAVSMLVYGKRRQHEMQRERLGWREARRLTKRLHRTRCQPSDPYARVWGSPCHHPDRCLPENRVQSVGLRHARMLATPTHRNNPVGLIEHVV